MIAVCASCALGCEASRFSVETRCGANADDDGDGAFGCADPDCWAADVCAAHKAEPIGGAPTAGVGGSEDDDAGQAERADPGVVTHGEDAGEAPSSLPDANVPFVCGDVAFCKGDEICFAGACVKVPKYATKYLITIKSAVVPNRQPLDRCFDLPISTDSVCIGTGILICGNCLPDPYVEVSVNETVVATTPYKKDEEAPTWSYSFELALSPSDQLLFAVKDQDSGDPDDLIFSCVPDLSALKTSTVVSCVPDPKLSPTLMQPSGETPWSITAQFEPIGAIAE